jgi:hypothetical protein
MRTPKTCISILRTAYKYLICLTLIGLCLGCAARHPTFSSVTEKGVLPVSKTNPFMGANLFLAHEMEESNYLYNFLRREGAPQAIKVTGNTPPSSLLELYYVNRLTLYRATAQLDLVLGTREWMIEGPYPIDRQTYQQVHALQGEGVGGLFEIFGKRELLDGHSLSSPTRVIKPVFIPTPKPPKRKTYKKAKGKKQVLKETKAASSTPHTTETPMNYDQKALFEARKRMAPTAKNNQTEKTHALESALEHAVQANHAK